MYCSDVIEVQETSVASLDTRRKPRFLSWVFEADCKLAMIYFGGRGVLIVVGFLPAATQWADFLACPLHLAFSPPRSACRNLFILKDPLKSLLL